VIYLPQPPDRRFDLLLCKLFLLSLEASVPTLTGFGMSRMHPGHLLSSLGPEKVLEMLMDSSYNLVFILYGLVFYLQPLNLVFF